MNLHQLTSYLTQRFGAIKLNNNGAVARDHLANERTFLAWLRTALSFASIGVAITQFFRLQSSTNLQNLLIASTMGEERAILINDKKLDGSTLPTIVPGSVEFYEYVDLLATQDRRLSKFSTILGGWFIATGIFVVMLALWRYGVSQHYLQKGKFPASRFSVVATFFVTLAVSTRERNLGIVLTRDS